MPAILFTTLLALSALYLPQPLLPVLMREFGVSRETAALLTTITFLPLSLAPLFYGLLLESFSARRMLRAAVLLLAISEVVVFFCTSFGSLLAVRFFQGLLVPAMLTALMTCTSRFAPPGEVPRAMAWYIAATILGGFAGRFLSGLIASLVNWRFSFLLLGVSLLIAWFWLGRMPETGSLQLHRPNLRVIGNVLADPVMRTCYAMVFCFFLVFAAMMNYLPFRLTDLSPKADELRIGAAYVGYLLGIVMSLNAVRLQKRFGGAERVMVGSLVAYLFALAVMSLPSVQALIIGMFFLCGASFLAHSTAAGFLNRYASGRQGVVNGMYVSFYYAGGAFGSYLPGFVYRGFGWTGYMLTLSLVIVIALLLAIRLARSSS
jgi:YNFM family putative membrane transporter